MLASTFFPPGRHSCCEMLAVLCFPESVGGHRDTHGVGHAAMSAGVIEMMLPGIAAARQDEDGGVVANPCLTRGGKRRSIFRPGGELR